jgi:hypothetical protein
MKATFFLCMVFFAAALLAPTVAAQTEEVNGTWSGSWIPQGGVRDAITVELRQDGEGKLTGKFLTPAPLEFTKASFNSKTRAVILEAVDEKNGKNYKIEVKIQGTELQGTELQGTLVANDVKGSLHLVKWTYVPR